MNDIAEAAGLSRAALYLAFKNKEEIFVGVVRQWVEETLVEIERAMAKLKTPEEKILLAFELWAVRPFEMMLSSPEAKEIVDCSFDFAQPALREGYARFEATIVPELAMLAERLPARASLGPKKIAHVLASAVHGFKQTATTPPELRRLIEDLLALSLSLG
jgi:AcrR family transcriptional regulator